MTDRIAEQGAVQYAQSNPSAPASRLGAAGWLQGAIADAVANGSASLTASRLGGNGRIHALASAAGPGFLFGNGERGVWLDFFDTSTTFQDAGATTPATATTDPIGYVRDKSGNGNNATQATSGAKMLLAVNAHGKVVAQADGFDDFLVTQSITWGTDEVTVFSAIRKSSDAAQGMVCELSVTSVSNNGTFNVQAPNSAVVYLATGSKGTASSNVVITDAAYVAPLDALLCFDAKISTDLNQLCQNGTLIGSVATDQGTGNYGSYPLYIGMRGGVAAPFNGDYSSLIIVNRLCSAAEKAAVLVYQATAMGVTL